MQQQRIVTSGIDNMDVTEVRMWLKILRNMWRRSSQYNPLVSSQKLGKYTIHEFCFNLLTGHMRKRQMD